MNPISIIEGYFQIQLEPNNLREFETVDDDRWIDFCKQYWASYQSGFSERYFGDDNRDGGKSRFFFEHRLNDAWRRAIKCPYGVSPLLGKDHYLIRSDSSTKEEVSAMLTPLKKHLLLGDQVFIPDPFLQCIDYVGEVVSRNTWRSTAKTQVPMTIRAIKTWLPVLAHLKPLIECEALIFMPYFESPAFQGGLHGPGFDKIRGRLAVREGKSDRNYVRDRDEIAAAWLSGYLLGVDPVLPDKQSLDLARRLTLVGSSSQIHSVMTDPISFQVDVLSSPEKISLDDLVSWRSNDELFHEIRGLTTKCKDRVSTALGPDPTSLAVEGISRDFLRESLKDYEASSRLNWASSNIFASNSIAICVGLLTAPLDGGLGSALGLAANPTNWRKGQVMRDKRHRAHMQLLSVI